jgi:endonuclease YncB( thermonuclease family)
VQVGGAMKNRKALGGVLAAAAICCVGVMCLGAANSFLRNTIGLLPTYTPESTKTQTTIQTDTPTPAPTTTQTPTETPEPTITVSVTAFLPLIEEGITATETSNQVIPESDIFSCILIDTKQEIGLVVSITDGDTIDVQIDGVTYPVRYIGMDTPEYNEPYGDLATVENSKLVQGKTVTLVKDVSETDPYDRLLRYVIVDGLFVNYELVRRGYAEAVEYPPDTSCQFTFQQAEQSARSEAIGLWGIAAIETPTQEFQASSSVVISKIYYDGQEPQVEGDEYAEITNIGNEPVNLEGWRLNAGSPGQDFRFPLHILEPGQSCRVYTNEDHQETCGFNYRKSQPVWNNKGDCGYLFNAVSVQVDEYCY